MELEGVFHAGVRSDLRDGGNRGIDWQGAFAGGLSGFWVSDNECTMFGGYFILRCPEGI